MENVPEITGRVHKYMAKRIKRLAKLVLRVVADPRKSRGRRHTPIDCALALICALLRGPGGIRSVFTLAENEHITFHTADLRGSCDTRMWIEDDGTSGYSRIPDAARRWMRTDDDGGYEALASQLHFVAPRAGTYFLKLLPYGSHTLGAYTLYVQRMGNTATPLPAMP